MVGEQLRLRNIETSMCLSQTLPEIHGDPILLEQVLLNLITNARYALNKKFSDFHTDKVLEVKGEFINIEGRKYVRTTFWDQGSGISPDILHKVCEPFFSTKPAGEGMGLGLSISYGIVKNHGGRLHIESVERENTKVFVDLPVSDGS